MHEIEISHSVASFLRRALGLHGSVKRGLRDLISFSFLCRVMSTAVWGWNDCDVVRCRKSSCGPAVVGGTHTRDFRYFLSAFVCPEQKLVQQLFKEFPVTVTTRDTQPAG